MNRSSTPRWKMQPGNPKWFGAQSVPVFRPDHGCHGRQFFLYYLGCFGTVDGPLTPAKMGAALAGLGVTRRHVILLLLSILIGAISWNWCLT